ncbi:MAG TPA: FtsX-like permease family protein [Candidatus Aminicenantes bacterium]|nr:FtsX-like permease family protein [Candidatus Aminicenantes bacterium]
MAGHLAGCCPFQPGGHRRGHAAGRTGGQIATCGGDAVMRLARSVKISRKQLMAHKLRSILALVGIIIGVSAVIVMVAIGNGAQEEVLSKIRDMGTNLVIVNAGQAEKSAGRAQMRGAVTTLRLEDVEAIKNNLDLIRNAAPIQSKKVQVKFANLSSNTTVVGTSHEFPEVRSFCTQRGIFFSESENRASRRVAVLGRSVDNNLFEGTEPIGKTIRVGQIQFEVIGVMESKGVDLNGVDQDDQIFIPIQTALRRVFNQDYISSIYLQTNGPDEMAAAKRQVRELLRERHRLNRSDKPDDFTIQSQTELMDAQRETTDTFTALIASIGGVSLLIGGIGILAIMLIAIRERRKEIGLRMAVGASRKDITWQFVVESAILSVGGGLIGIALGIAVALVIAVATDWNTSVSLASILAAFGFSLLVGLIFGVSPARKASMLDPIVALRGE